MSSLETSLCSQTGHRGLVSSIFSTSTFIGFHHSRIDSTLFILHLVGETAYLLLYVDDIIFIFPTSYYWQNHHEFAMIDLGYLNFFLSIYAIRSSTSLFLLQQKYATEILEWENMTNCNPFRNLTKPIHKLDAPGSHNDWPHIVVLQVLFSISHVPEIAFIVKRICLYMHDPWELHLHALKRILQYVWGTLDHGLQLYISSTPSLIAYCDADWEGFPVTRHSTLGYYVFLGDNLNSWSSKRIDTISNPTPRLNTTELPTPLQKSLGSGTFYLS